jgi:hypothetical protein
MPSMPEVRRVAERGYWRETDARIVVEAWRRSGESLTRFSAKLGLEPRRLGRWASRLKPAAAAAAPLRFHRVELVESPQAHGSIEIELASGERVHVRHGFEAEDLRRVLAVLAAAGTC